MKSDDSTEKRTEEPHGHDSDREGFDAEESITSIAGTAKKASKAVKDTAQKYLDAAGVEIDLDDIEKSVRDRPRFYLVLAAGAGFVVGGGLATNLGVALLALLGRKAAVETATNFGRQVLQQAVAGGEARAGRASGPTGKCRSGKYLMDRQVRRF